MIYIFGNIIHQDSEVEFVKKLNRFGFKHSDCFVHLNRCKSFKYGIEFFKDKVNYSMHNTDSCQNSPFGIFDMLDYRNYFKEAILSHFRIKLGKNTATIEEFNTGEVVNQQIRCEINPRYIYPVAGLCKKPYTIGFYSYFFWRRYLQDDVTLVNFYGPDDITQNAKSVEKYHDLIFEHKYLDQINAQRIYI